MRSHQPVQGIGLWRQRAKEARPFVGGNEHSRKVLHVDAIDKLGLIFHVDPNESHGGKVPCSLSECVPVLAAG